MAQACYACEWKSKGCTSVPASVGCCYPQRNKGTNECPSNKMHAQYGLMIVITIQVEQRFPSAIDLGFVMSLK